MIQQDVQLILCNKCANRYTILLQVSSSNPCTVYAKLDVVSCNNKVDASCILAAIFWATLGYHNYNLILQLKSNIYDVQNNMFVIE